LSRSADESLAPPQSSALLGTALLAYIFGLRHAFDADHMAAIDNLVRKLMQEGKTPYSVGFFFALGHSIIVVLASIAIAATRRLCRASSMPFMTHAAVIGTLVSAIVLLVIGFANSFGWARVLSHESSVRYAG
jgi:high-affinity nickel-transport protein